MALIGLDSDSDEDEDEDCEAWETLQTADGNSTMVCYSLS